MAVTVKTLNDQPSEVTGFKSDDTAKQISFELRVPSVGLILAVSTKFQLHYFF
jgi:hypothetical protein